MSNQTSQEAQCIGGPLDGDAYPIPLPAKHNPRQSFVWRSEFGSDVFYRYRLNFKFEETVKIGNDGYVLRWDTVPFWQYDYSMTKKQYESEI